MSPDGMDGWDGISPDRSISRSPSGDKNVFGPPTKALRVASLFIGRSGKTFMNDLLAPNQLVA